MHGVENYKKTEAKHIVGKKFRSEVWCFLSLSIPNKCS